MLPREIQTEHWPDRTTYDFPVRPIGKLRLVGLLPMAFSVAFAWMPGKMWLQMFRQVLGRDAGTGEWIGLAFLSIFILAAFLPFTIGMFLLIGRSRLVATRESLRITEIAGPFRRSRKVRIADIQRLEFGSAESADQRTRAATPAWLARVGGMTAITRDGKKRMLLVGYPADWLEAVAAELSGYMEFAGNPVEVKQVAALRSSVASPADDDTVARPVDSRVTVTVGVSGVEIVVPPVGFRSGSRSMLMFAVVWCLFMSVFTGLMVFSGIGKGQHIPWPAWLFIAAFWCIGLGMLAGAINMARRAATLTASRGTLRVQQQGPFGTQAREWRPGEIAAICAGPSGMAVNDVPVIELQILPAAGKKAGLFAGRAEAELRWLASELRKALGVPATRAGKG